MTIAFTIAPATLADARFRTLVGEEAWAQLPEARASPLFQAPRPR